jgi:hypothetical protein
MKYEQANGPLALHIGDAFVVLRSGRWDFQSRFLRSYYHYCFSDYSDSVAGAENAPMIIC